MADFAGRKALAAHLGFQVSEGRGRLAKDAAAAVDAALSKGTHRIVKDGQPVASKPATAAATVKPAKAPKPAKVTTSTVVEEAPKRYPDSVRPVEVGTGKVRALATACMDCGVSVQWCKCRQPLVVRMDGKSGGIRLTMEV